MDFYLEIWKDTPLYLICLPSNIFNTLWNFDNLDLNASSFLVITSLFRIYVIFLVFILQKYSRGYFFHMILKIKSLRLKNITDKKLKTNLVKYELFIFYYFFQYFIFQMAIFYQMAILIIIQMQLTFGKKIAKEIKLKRYIPEHQAYQLEVMWESEKQIPPSLFYVSEQLLFPSSLYLQNKHLSLESKVEEKDSLTEEEGVNQTFPDPTFPSPPSTLDTDLMAESQIGKLHKEKATLQIPKS